MDEIDKETIRDCIQGVISTLEYHYAQEGFLSCNYITAGLPEFADDSEYEAYIAKLNAVLAKL